MIYLIGFAVSALSLAGWFYYREKKPWDAIFRNLFFGSFAVYALGRLFQDVAFSEKFADFFPELITLGAVGLSMQWLLRFRKWYFIGIVVLVAGLTWYVKKQSSSGAEGIVLDPSGEFLVELKEGVSTEQFAQWLDNLDLKASRAFFPQDAAVTTLDNYYVIDIPNTQMRKMNRIRKEIQKSPLVDWLEDNEEITVAPNPSVKPPEINKRFGINDPGVAHLWGFDAIGMDRLYNYLASAQVNPRKKARIAILDTGIDAQHEDIKGNYVSIKSTYDNDPQGHGTHCAGIAGAVSNNGVGVASFSRDNKYSSISSVKVLNSSGMGTQQSIIAGMIEAADNGVDVFSMSLGGRSNQPRQRAYEKAVQYAAKKGAIVVVAAGNSNRNAKEFAPANTPGIITVSAIDQQQNRAFFSNYVNDLDMGIAAPGVEIYSTIPGSKYAAYNGTSMATPYVAGLVGLMKSIRPSLTTREAYDILKATGKETRNTRETGRLIQPEAAIKALLK